MSMQKQLIPRTKVPVTMNMEPQGHRGNPREWYAIDADTDSGKLITAFNAMDKELQQRLLGYAEALSRRQ